MMWDVKQGVGMTEDTRDRLLMAVAELSLAMAKRWDAMSIGDRLRVLDRILAEAQRERDNPAESR